MLKNILEYLLRFFFRSIQPALIFFILFHPTHLAEYEFPTFRLVLDPGHGGVCMFPRSVHGDRYDPISKTYLDEFRDGASRRNIYEHEIVYSIARKVQKLLGYCAPGGDFESFKQILEKYTDGDVKQINIIVKMSREKSMSEEKAEKMEDPNAGYRLFDFPDENDNKQYGRISKINSFRPHLVVSLHLAGAAPDEYKGMNPVLAAPYRLLENGLKYLRHEITDQEYFHEDPLSDWFCESNRRTPFQWHLSDVSQYFTGFPLDRHLNIEKKEFKGYRQNMVTWRYNDSPGWEQIAIYHFPYSRYSMDYNDVVPEGRFWEREQSVYESYRRDGGYEGFGGDNSFASYELIRYILYSLNISGNSHPKQVPGKSYVSIWILPMHINAINAFIELGYLNRQRDRYILLNKQEEIAEGIAVGIYSLFAGLTPREKSVKNSPLGKKIDLDKYKISNDTSYFDLVWDE
ncbi:MAG: hypothetical protein CVV44_00185 [Spirochaetae bacterium HGW-Spirochaetae-1]|jgi:hypothetical protein|nr:MAG: hypothetical protein CVV44_00185 [Spirochaetae bacterium HGW-Spirochaetae-1]